MNVLQLFRRHLIRSVLVVLLLSVFGGMVGCKTVDVDRGGGHDHDDHHDYHDHY